MKRRYKNDEQVSKSDSAGPIGESGLAWTRKRDLIRLCTKRKHSLGGQQYAEDLEVQVGGHHEQAR